MDRIVAEHAILNTMYRLAYAQDELDRQAMLELFLPDSKFTLDLSGHLSDYSSVAITPTELFEETRWALSGFTVTQHLLGNRLITFEDDRFEKAHVNIMINAYHCIEMEDGIESVTARGTWHIDVELWQGKWVCRNIVIKRDVPLDNPRLYDVAKQRAENGKARK